MLVTEAGNSNNYLDEFFWGNYFHNSTTLNKSAKAVKTSEAQMRITISREMGKMEDDKVKKCFFVLMSSIKVKEKKRFLRHAGVLIAKKEPAEQEVRCMFSSE